MILSLSSFLLTATSAFQILGRIRLSALVVLIAMHPVVTKVVFQFFKCRDYNGRELLVADASIECGSEKHAALVWGSGVPAIIFYVLGIPATLFLFLYLNRDTLAQEDTRVLLGFAYSNYRPSLYFWEVVVIARLVMFALISVSFREDPRLQASLGLAVLFFSVLAHVLCNPFASKALHQIEAAALIGNWMTLFCGTLLFNERISADVKLFITFCIVGIQIVYLGFSCFLLWTGGQREVPSEAHIEMTVRSRLPTGSIPRSGDTGDKATEATMIMIDMPRQKLRSLKRSKTGGMRK